MFPEERRGRIAAITGTIVLSVFVIVFFIGKAMN